MSRKQREKDAHILYNKMLKDVEKVTGDRTTYLQQLNKVGKEMLGVKYKGTFPSDKIPRLNDLSPYCILNLDKSTEPGSHWVALAKHGNDSILYDSFGRDNKKIIPNLRYSGNGQIFNTDRDVEQKISQSNCGARSICWLKFLDEYGIKNAMLI
jgi:hypothetical protein